MPESKKPLVPVHPLIASRKQDTKEPASTVRLGGYGGPPSQPGLVRLYSTLDDLSHYLEFAESAVVQTAEAPETVLPNKGLFVWVKASAQVRWVREYKNAQVLAATITRSLRNGPRTLPTGLLQ